MSRRYTQITLADRRRLHQLVAAKVPVNEMARQLGRHRSTIYREIKRNTFHDRELPEYDGYYSTVAHDIARDRRCRLRKLRRHPALRTQIINQLEARWSPEQIAGRLLSDGLSRIRVCKETIYRFIYSKEEYELGLYQYLTEARRKRRPMHSRKPRDGAFPASQRISQRPDFIRDRSRFGHWEGDLLIFDRPLGPANVTTLVERKSRYTVLIKNPSRHSGPIMDKIIRAFSPLPAFARQRAGVPGISRSQMHRPLKAYETGGTPGLVSKKRQQLSNRRHSEDLRNAVLDLVRERYADFGPTSARGKLIELHQLAIGKETLRQWMIQAGIWIYRRERKKRVVQPRGRRDCFGELAQIDGSHHWWFENRGPKCALLVSIDDATGKLLHLRFAGSEDTFDYMHATKAYLQQWGKPLAFYSDKHRVFRSLHPSKKDRTSGLKPFGSALFELNIGIICANTAACRFRSEVSSCCRGLRH